MRSWLHKKAAFVAAGLVLVLIAGVAAADFIFTQNTHTTTGFAMGTVLVQRLTGKGADKSSEEILRQILRLETERLSWRSKESDIARINQGGGTVQISQETAQILQELQELSKRSGGAFDFTLGQLTRLWDFDSGTPQLPGAKELSEAKKQTGWSAVQIDGDTVSLQKSGIQLDLGAVGKGAACDTAKQVLEESSLTAAAVSVGGSVLIWNRNPSKTQTVAVRDPLGSANDSLGTLELTNCVVSTSGSYERFFDKDGIRYHHILDPATGMPAQTGLLSVTAVSTSGLMSDALSTACFVLGYEKSLPLLEAYQAQGLFVFEDKTIRVTQGLDFSLTNQAYHLEEQ